jgi:hypothetical protein
MKRVFILVFITIIAGIFISGFAPKTETDRDVTSVIYENLNAMEKRDLQSFMATIHEQSPVIAQTEQMALQLLNTYELSCELKDVKVIEKSDQEARVKYVQITKKVSGPEFRNNKVTGIHILKKSDGKWKIYNTEIKDIKYLDQVVHWGGFLLGAFVVGALCGLLPLILALKKQRLGLALGSWISCVIAGLVLGLILAVPVSIVFTVVILCLKKAEREDLGDGFAKQRAERYAGNRAPYSYR